ncbi:unnamed protein product [Lymnaea stagnalis]|uniref:Ig-like domain-containing protein n=1 Tax=Lymnaea stagnalis TaxID=6523 RepID=A0AAV2IQS0_LYMST
MEFKKTFGISMLMAFFILTQNDFCVTPASSAVAVLKSFTVNGQSTTVTVGDRASLTFQCAKLDNVGEPILTVKATKLGKFIFGSPEYNVRSTSVTTTITADCKSGDVYECKATDDAGNVDSKTVEVKVSCSNGGSGGGSGRAGHNGVEVLKAGPFTLSSLLIVMSLRRFLFQ